MTLFFIITNFHVFIAIFKQLLDMQISKIFENFLEKNRSINILMY